MSVRFELLTEANRSESITVHIQALRDRERKCDDLNLWTEADVDGTMGDSFDR